MSKRYVLAFYEVFPTYGGPEEGGWWYNAYQMVRPYRILRDHDEAVYLMRRANRLFSKFKVDPNSVIYDGGAYTCMMFEVEDHPDVTVIPLYLPTEIPHYE